MQPVVPSWFKQRQAKAEEVSDNLNRLTGPNMPDTFITIRQGDNGLWQAVLMQGAQGPEMAATPAEFDRPTEAWEAAFELHRVHVIV